MSHRTIEFTPNKLTALKKALAQAEGKSQNAFQFEGNEYKASYAKYLIQYLTPLFNEPHGVRPGEGYYGFPYRVPTKA